MVLDAEGRGPHMHVDSQRLDSVREYFLQLQLGEKNSEMQGDTLRTDRLPHIGTSRWALMYARSC